MLHTNLVYNLLASQFWNITAALPSGASGTRPTVGFPEVIPDVIFLARPLTAADGNFSTTELTHWNGYTSNARSFHTTYGLAPIDLNSFEHLLDHPRLPLGPIGRIRLVSHGSAIPEGLLFLPMFNGGLWDFGTRKSLLRALKDGDDAALRLLMSTDASDATQSPLLTDVVNQLITGIRAARPAVLQPFGLQASGVPPPEVMKYFELVNDLYQVRYGTIVIGSTLLSAPQKVIYNTSLTTIENAILARLDGQTIGGVTYRRADLQAFRDAVLAATPTDLGFLGPTPALSATLIADLQTALAASPRVENDIRTAIRGSSGQPVLGWDYLDGIINAIEVFHPTALHLGTTTHDAGTIRTGDLEAFVLVALDLHHLKNGPISIGGAPSTGAQKASLRAGLMAISNIIRDRISAPITAPQLNNLRDKIENLPLERSALTGLMKEPSQRPRMLSTANASMQAGFRTKLDTFRARMQPANASKVDIRGCLVANDPDFLTAFRELFGTNANQPVVTAPNRWQSFPFAFQPEHGTIIPKINALVAGGMPADNISAADVDAAIVEWRGLIGFDPHFDFITALFAAGASQIDFASLEWRVWRTGAAATGIPVLGMQASLVDDLASLNLGDVIERFRVIFEIPAASAPNSTARVRLTQLQPLLVTFKTINANVAAAAAPSQQFLTDLSGLATSITAIHGFTPATAPTVPSNPSPTLQDIRDALGLIRTHLETVLGNELNTLFAAIQGRTAPTNANARIQYYYGIGLPLLLRSSSTPPKFVISIFVSTSSSTVFNDLIVKALRSWMRIQWVGTPAQMTAMNAVIQHLALSNAGEMSRVSMLTDEDPMPPPGQPVPTDSGVHPTQAYHDHIVSRPP